MIVAIREKIIYFRSGFFFYFFRDSDDGGKNIFILHLKKLCAYINDLVLRKVQHLKGIFINKGLLNYSSSL